MIVDALIELLESFGYPVYRQGSLQDDEGYPATFFTFWNNSGDGLHHYDNADFSVEYDFDVNVYSNDPEVTYSLLDDARALLKDNGWIANGRGYDLPTDEPTHTGRGFNAVYVDYNVTDNND